MAIKTYTEWKEAVNRESTKLNAVREYLNDAGRERLMAFSTLVNMAVYADTAKELWNDISNRDELLRDEEKALYPDGDVVSDHIVSALLNLRRLARGGKEIEQ